MPSAAFPRAQSAIADQSGRPTREWYTYFLELRDSAGLTPAQQQQLDDLAARVAALEGDGGSGGTIQGVGSIITYGAPPGIIQITLEGDSDAPGNTWYYGTGPDGTRAWYSLADGFSVTADLTKAVDGTTGVTTYGLADLANSGTGTLLAITRDAKGRILGTRAATITGTAGQIDVANGTAAAGLPTISLSDLANSGTGTAVYKTTRDAKGRISGQVAATTNDLPEGASNLYFTNARAAAAAPVQSVNARTGTVSVPDFVSKATAPTSSDYGRALVNGDRWRNTGNGVLYTYQGGAWLYDNAASLSRYVPARLSGGTSSPIPLNADGTIPARLSNGTVSNIPTQA